MSTETSDTLGLNPQYVRIGALFAVLSTVLAIAYFAFLREDYAILYDDLRAEQAAAVVEQLDAQNIPYRLERNGAQIQVASSRTGEARLSIAGSEVGRGGLSGFELFDDSDMGLTDFAQKIKYQRALQGELARTILQQEGIDRARVHISMPERALFRGDQNPANAAVSLVAEAGVVLSDSRIEGIQRLVAAAVPELDYRDVVVLDGNGEVISRSALSDFQLAALQIAPGATPPADRAVIESARALIAPLLAGLAFDVTIDSPAPSPEAPATAIGQAEAEPATLGQVRILTEIPLSAAQETALVAVLTDNAQMTAGEVSGVAFELQSPSETRLEARALAASDTTRGVTTGSVRDTASALPAVAVPPRQAARLANTAPEFGTWIGAVLWLLVLLAAAIAAGMFVWRRVTTPTLSVVEHEKLADRLRADLASLDEGGPAHVA